MTEVISNQLHIPRLSSKTAANKKVLFLVISCFWFPTNYWQSSVVRSLLCSAAWHTTKEWTKKHLSKHSRSPKQLSSKIPIKSKPYLQYLKITKNSWLNRWVWETEAINVAKTEGSGPCSFTDVHGVIFDVRNESILSKDDTQTLYLKERKKLRSCQQKMKNYYI